MMHEPNTQPSLAAPASAVASGLVAPKPAHADDWALVQDCITGDRAAWAALVQRAERTLYFAVLNTLRACNSHAPRERVEDIQADVLVELVRDDFRRLRKYSGRCKLTQWLKVVASNYTIDLLRKQRPTVSLSDDTPSAQALRAALPDHRTPSPDRSLQRHQLTHALRTLCDHLPDEDRRFVDLFYHQELSFDEVAQRMDTTVGAVYARKNRVRKKLIALAEQHHLR